MTDATTGKPATSDRYGAVSIAFHWAIAVLLVGMVFYGWWMEGLRDQIGSGVSMGSVQTAYNWHKTTGIVILILSLARLGWRLAHPVPPLPGHMATWEKAVARFTHIGFYVIMIGVPLAGYVTASAFGDLFPIKLFDAIELPKLPVPQTEDFQGTAGSIHGASGWVILGMLALHAGGAIKHHVLDRDGVLTRMIPGLNIPEQKNRP